MDNPDYRSWPDEHLKPSIAAVYDRGLPSSHDGEAIDQTASLLSELANGGKAVEFAVGTGRIALPLARLGTTVHGIDFSDPMLAELAKKDGANQVAVTAGSMTETVVCDDASLVYLVFNTIGNVKTQEEQVAVFRNAASHLVPGGRFLIEVIVPGLHRLSPAERIRPFDVSPNHLGFDEYVDLTNQILISHHYYIEDNRARTVAGSFRFVWPSELDLMAQLAGMTLESRWAGWNREPFTDDSPSHVSVWRKL